MATFQMNSCSEFRSRANGMMGTRIHPLEKDKLKDNSALPHSPVTPPRDAREATAHGRIVHGGIVHGEPAIIAHPFGSSGGIHQSHVTSLSGSADSLRGISVPDFSSSNGQYRLEGLGIQPATAHSIFTVLAFLSPQLSSCPMIYFTSLDDQSGGFSSQNRKHGK